MKKHTFWYLYYTPFIFYFIFYFLLLFLVYETFIFFDHLWKMSLSHIEFVLVQGKLYAKFM